MYEVSVPPFENEFRGRKFSHVIKIVCMSGVLLVYSLAFTLGKIASR